MVTKNRDIKAKKNILLYLFGEKERKKSNFRLSRGTFIKTSINNKPEVKIKLRMLEGLKNV